MQHPETVTDQAKPDTEDANSQHSSTNDPPQPYCSRPADIFRTCAADCNEQHTDWGGSPVEHVPPYFDPSTVPFAEPKPHSIIGIPDRLWFRRDGTPTLPFRRGFGRRSSMRSSAAYLSSSSVTDFSGFLAPEPDATAHSAQAVAGSSQPGQSADHSVLVAGHTGTPLPSLQVYFNFLYCIYLLNL